MSLVRVLEIPPSDGKFRFGGGAPQTFVEVDWFRDDPGVIPTPNFGTTEGREQVEKFIRQKNYFDPAKAYLVLHPQHSFTIGYKAP